MSTESDSRAAVPAVPFMAIDTDGRPHLVGSRCAGCGAVRPETRSVCAACGARSGIEAVRLSERGRLYSYTIVHRSFPGVRTPFVAAIVDLDGGGSLKGTLVEVEPDPKALTPDMPVQIVYRDCGQKAADGSPFLAYYFVPSRGDSA